LTRALTLYQSLDNAAGASWSLLYLAQVEIERGNADNAQTLVNRALDTISRIDFPWVQCAAHFVLGQAALLTADLTGARQHFEQAIHIAHRVRSVMQTVRHLAGIAALLLAEGNAPSAIRIAAFADTHPASWFDIQKMAQRILGAARSQVTADVFEAEQVCGQSYDLDEMVAEVLSA
jgi:ATP/maltotriose-dependent transcriptional regulator MalT